MLRSLKGSTTLEWPESEVVTERGRSDQRPRQLIDRAHARGLRIYGATLTPFEGGGILDTRGRSKRQALNTWIRTSGAYDAVLDFAAVVQDPTPAIKRRAQNTTSAANHLH